MINIDVLQQRMNYFFKDKSLLKQALTHKSANFKHNERLEFLGDAILNFVVADLLYKQFPQATEGELTRVRASLVRKVTLAELAMEFSLGDFLHLGTGERRSGGFRRESILADALEAIIGAIYQDANFTVCWQCIEGWFRSRLATLKPEEQKKDPKTRLQEWLQANQKSLPLYQIISTVGEAHAQIFTVSCEVDGISEAVEGCGPSRRIAEQQAAQKILELINHDIHE